MLRIITFTLSICIGLTLASCEKENTEQTLLDGRWVASGISTTNGTIEPNTSYFLEFPDVENYTVSLDVNDCGGEFTISEKDRILFKFLNCSEACCDSSFANKLTALLQDVTKYEIVNKSLKLSNEEGDFRIDFRTSE